MSPEIEAAIRQAAEEEGVDPAFALAVADRESAGNPNAHASRSIYGLFQMRGDLRHQYGAGDSNDPYTQAQGWMRFINDTRQGLANRLGRDPTNEETYLAHFFGEGRAARMIGGQIGGSTPTADAFTPNELAINPEIRNAGMVGNLTGRIGADIRRREAQYGGAQGWSNAPIDFAQFGQPLDGMGRNGQNSAAGSGAQPIDFAQFGTALQGENQSGGKNQPVDFNHQGPPQNSGDLPQNSGRPGTEIDLSQFGLGAAA